MENNLIDIANKMVVKGKGILAADESTPTCTKRFNGIGVESTYESRNEYRDMLFSSTGLEEYISGVIMFDETLRQSTTCQKKELFTDYLISKNINANYLPKLNKNRLKSSFFFKACTLIRRK